ncbi:MAG: helix-hairpin-helix domain-containing protein [Tepidisphaeraceae bacterium]
MAGDAPAEQSADATPPKPPTLAEQLSFTAPQRRALVLILGCLLVYAGYRYWTNPVYIADPQPAEGDLAATLADKLDPNTASAADLAALPGLGAKRAAAIVARRDRVRQRDPHEIPYRNPDDLLKVSGFGVSTVAQLRPFLIFPTTAPTSQIMADKSRTAP